MGEVRIYRGVPRHDATAAGSHTDPLIALLVAGRSLPGYWLQKYANHRGRVWLRSAVGGDRSREARRHPAVAPERRRRPSQDDRGSRGAAGDLRARDLPRASSDAQDAGEAARLGSREEAHHGAREATARTREAR